MNMNFLFLGNNSDLLDQYCYDFNHETWEDITDFFNVKIKEKHPDVVFSKLNQSQKIDMIKKIQPDIKTVQDGLFVTTEFKSGENVIFLDEFGEFQNVSQFSLKKHLYSNYNKTDDHFSFLTIEGQKFKNGILKKEIDFHNMATSNNNFMLQKYDVYHKVKKQLQNSPEFSEGENSSITLILELVNHYGHLFSEHEEFRFFELPLIDFLNYHSIEDFIPDFYFNLSGKPIFIYDDNLEIYAKNINSFIVYLKRLISNTKLTIYDYQL